VKYDCTHKRVSDTYEEFYTVDQQLPETPHSWGASVQDVGDTPSGIFDGPRSALSDACRRLGSNQAAGAGSALDTIQLTADVVSSSFGEFVATDWRPKHGTGAVADLRVGKDYKYLFPHWSARLEREFPVTDFGIGSIDSISSDEYSNLFRDEECPSRLITVPKTMKGPRLIACEPTSNQYCQQVIRGFLESSVKQGLLSSCLDFSNQSLNGSLCLTASITRSHATIDLSSASDRVSCWLVDRIFRANKTVLNALVASRTPEVMDMRNGVITRLRKFTTMGAATTFPVEAIIFAIIIAGCLLHHYNLPVTRANVRRVCRTFRVFGDDLIVPVDVADSLIEHLEILYLKVNRQKTFKTGWFRESCGTDAYMGETVTPTYVTGLYVEERPTTIIGVTECANNLHIAGYWRTADALRRQLPQSVISSLPVVSSRSGSFGLKSFCGSSISHLKRRWNGDLQRDEVRCFTIRRKAERHQPEGYASLLQYYIEGPRVPTSQSIVVSQYKSGYEKRSGDRIGRRWEAAAALRE
jgi:hypothetical protein